MKRRWAWIGAGLALVLAGGLVAFAVTSGGGRSTPIAATTTTVERGDVDVTASAAGTVQAVHSRTLSFRTNGTISELSVKAGDAVAAGQVLARLDTTDAQAAVESAQSGVDDAEDAVDRAEAATATPTSCPTTTVGPATTGAPATTGGPAATGGPTSRPNSSAQQASGCGQTTRSSGSDSLLSAEQQLNNAKLSLVRAELQLAGATITAPVAGKVLSVAAGVGDQANQGGAFIVLAGSGDVAVQAQFSEADVAGVALGQPASIELADRPGETLTGKVIQVAPAGVASGQLVRYAVLVAFDQPPADALLGESATVAVTTAQAAGVLYVSSTAITGVEDGTGAVVVRVNGRDERRTVTIGLRGDRYTEIKAGLSEGEEVLLSP